LDNGLTCIAPVKTGLTEAQSNSFDRLQSFLKQHNVSVFLDVGSCFLIGLHRFCIARCVFLFTTVAAFTSSGCRRVFAKAAWYRGAVALHESVKMGAFV